MEREVFEFCLLSICMYSKNSKHLGFSDVTSSYHCMIWLLTNSYQKLMIVGSTLECQRDDRVSSTCTWWARLCRVWAQPSSHHSASPAPPHPPSQSQVPTTTRVLPLPLPQPTTLMTGTTNRSQRLPLKNLNARKRRKKVPLLLKTIIIFLNTCYSLSSHFIISQSFYNLQNIQMLFMLY